MSCIFLFVSTNIGTVKLQRTSVRRTGRQVRHLAARALVPLVPPNALASTIAAALADVPTAPAVACHNQARAMLYWDPSLAPPSPCSALGVLSQLVVSLFVK